MKAVLKKPGFKPIDIEIKNSLHDLQAAVGGFIECFQLNDDVLVICDEEGIIKGKPYNITLKKIHLVGDLLFVGSKGEEFGDCPFDSEMIQKEIAAEWE